MRRFRRQHAGQNDAADRGGGLWGAAVAAALAAAWLAGCTPRQYADQADKAAYGVVAQKQRLTLGQRRKFDIAYRAFCRDAGADGKLQLLRGGPIPIGDAAPRTLSLSECLEVAVRNSRSYQTRKEQLYTAALALSKQRRDWSGLDGLLTGDADWSRTQRGDTTHEASGGAAASFARQFAHGGALTLAAGLDAATSFLGIKNTTFGSLIEANLTQPLWRGGWRGFAYEDLYRAERDFAYSILEYERFTHTFAVDVATEYYRVLEQLDELNNERENLIRLAQTLKFNQARLEGGLIRKVQVDQAEQNVLSARARIESSRQRYDDALDDYKLTLGLPIASSVVLDMSELAELRKLEQAAKLPLPFDVGGGISRAIGEQSGREAEQKLRTAVGKAVDRTIQVAMLTRPDVLAAYSDLRDAGRDVEIAADAFNPRLDLLLGISAAGTDPRKPFRVQTHRHTRTAELSFEYSLDQRDNRDAYRRALIARDKARRDLDEFLDTVRLDVRGSFRRLVRSRRTYAIQGKAVALSIRRTKLVRDEAKEGLASTRDVLEAEDALRDSKNAMTSALVGYVTTRLRFLATLGMLSVDERGQIHERNEPFYFDRYRPDGG